MFRQEVFGYTSLSLACSVGHDQVVHLLLAHTSDGPRGPWPWGTGGGAKAVPRSGWVFGEIGQLPSQQNPGILLQDSL